MGTVIQVNTQRAPKITLYSDMAVGAYESAMSFLLKSRPVVEVQLAHELNRKYIKINGGSACPPNYKTW